jgi:hypothetical protein
MSELDWLRLLPGYPWLPCPICKGVEGCDHSYAERARAAHPGLQAIPSLKDTER